MEAKLKQKEEQLAAEYIAKEAEFRQREDALRIKEANEVSSTIQQLEDDTPAVTNTTSSATSLTLTSSSSSSSSSSFDQTNTEQISASTSSSTKPQEQQQQ